MADEPIDPLFDPLFSDQPIDLNAIAEDDRLIDAIASGNPDAAEAVADPDDPLVPFLAAWVATSQSAPPPPPPPPPPRVRVVITAPGPSPRIAPEYRAWLDSPGPTWRPGSEFDLCLRRLLVMAAFLICVLLAAWGALR